MMDINQQWNQLGDQQDEALASLLDERIIARLPSKDPLAKISRAILFNAGWGLLILAGYAILLYFFPFWPIIACIYIVALVTCKGVVSNARLYKQITRPAKSNTVLQEMQRHHDSIRQWIKMQQWAGLAIYPPSIAAGFMLGYYVGSGIPIKNFMHKPHVLLILSLTILLLVPVCWLLARWMSQKAFGRYADQLQQNIDALQREK